MDSAIRAAVVEKFARILAAADDEPVWWRKLYLRRARLLVDSMDEFFRGCSPSHAEILAAHNAISEALYSGSSYGPEWAEQIINCLDREVCDEAFDIREHHERHG